MGGLLIGLAGADGATLGLLAACHQTGPAGPIHTMEFSCWTAVKATVGTTTSGQEVAAGKYHQQEGPNNGQRQDSGYPDERANTVSCKPALEMVCALGSLDIPKAGKGAGFRAGACY